MNNLHYVPTPHPHESPTSLLRRIALNNGFITAPRFLSRTKLTLGLGLLFQNSEFQALLERENPEIDYQSTFYKQLHSKPSRLVDIGHCKIPILEMDCLTSGICTECIKLGWEHKIKDIKCTEYCPIHLRRYLRSCPHCHKNYTIFNQLSLLCSCGKCISSEATADPVEVETFLLSALERKDQATLDNFFYALNKLKYRTNTYSSELSRILVNCSMDIALGNLTKAYDRLNNNICYGSALSHIVIKAQILNATHSDSLLDPLYQLTPSQLENTGKIHGITLSTGELREILNLPYTYWLSHNPSHFKKSTRDRYTIEELLKISELFEEMHKETDNEIKSCIFLPQARTTLNVPKKILTKIYQAGYITKLDTPRIPRGANVAISNKSFEAFHKKYASIWEISNTLSSTAEKIQKAIKHAKIEYLYLPDKEPTFFIERKFITQIDKHLKLPTSKPPNPLEAVMGKTLTITTKTTLKKTNFITTKEACRRLNISPQKLYILIRHKVFKPYNLPGSGYTLDSEAISIFKRKFITLDEITKRTSLHGKLIATALSSHNIRSATLRNKSDAISFYNRTDINRINFFDSLHLDFIYHKFNNTTISYKHIQREFNLRKFELSMLWRGITRQRPLAYQSNYYNASLTPIEFKILRHTIENVVNLETLATEHKVSAVRIQKIFKIKKLKEIIHIREVAHVRKHLALLIGNFFNNYVSIYTAAELLHTNPTSVYKLIKAYPDKEPYLQATILTKCISASHLDFLFKLTHKLPSDFSGPLSKK